MRTDMSDSRDDVIENSEPPAVPYLADLSAIFMSSSANFADISPKRPRALAILLAVPITAWEISFEGRPVRDDLEKFDA